jgi:phytoene desaturase
VLSVRFVLRLDPAFYACISKRSEPTRAEAGHENLYLLIPCANLDRPFNDEEATALKKMVFDRLEHEVGFDRTKVVGEASWSPIEWQNELNLEKGAAFGISHDFWQSAYFRPGNKAKSQDGLYYVGASTTPGNGLPMVLISAELVVDRMQMDRLVPRRNG